MRGFQTEYRSAGTLKIMAPGILYFRGAGIGKTTLVDTFLGQLDARA